MSRNIWAGRLPFFGSGQPKVAKNVRSRAKCVKPVPPRRRSPSLRRRAPADLEPPGGLQQGPAGLLGGLAPGLRDGQLPLPPVGLHAHEHQVIARQVGDLDGLAGLRQKAATSSARWLSSVRAWTVDMLLPSFPGTGPFFPLYHTDGGKSLEKGDEESILFF